jgi:tetratricopeptide (TPR) repeat protein
MVSQLLRSRATLDGFGCRGFCTADEASCLPVAEAPALFGGRENPKPNRQPRIPNSEFSSEPFFVLAIAAAMMYFICRAALEEASMRNRVIALAVFVLCWGSAPLSGQQPCPKLSVVVNSPEDQLLLAVNGATDSPQDQIAALDKYSAEHADSPAMTCVNEYYTAIYVKQNDFQKAIGYGEKDVAAHYQDVNLDINLMKAYVGAGAATDNAFTVIDSAPDQIKTESTPTRPPGTSDADWQKLQADAADTAKQYSGYMEYAFFQLLPRVTDPNKRVEYLDAFAKAYPDSPNTGQLYFQYLVAYSALNNPTKANEYGEKAIAADPNNPTTLNMVADDYANRHVNLDKAEADAQKVLQLVPNMKKPDGVSDADFHTQQNWLLASAHFTLGSIDQQRGAATHKLAGAVKEFKSAADLAKGNPGLQGRALFYLGYSYELQVPADHHDARGALAEAAQLQSPWQGEAEKLLAKIPK